VPAYISDVTVFISAFLVRRISGEIWKVCIRLEICRREPSETQLRYEFRHKNQLRAKLADHALSEVGKLSFKERDVSLFSFLRLLILIVCLIISLLFIGLSKP
jgi:hypothetical protein